MKQQYPILPVLLLAAALMTLVTLPAAAEIPAQLPDPDGKPADQTKPVRVFILMGQSNMVGMGDISGGSSGWGKQSPRNHGYHYNRNAETYLLVGDALGRGMVELLDTSVVAELKAELKEQRVELIETDEAHSELQQIIDTH